MTQDFAAQGMPEEEARFAARRRFGNMTRTSEDARFTWIAHWISDLAQDLRYSFRGMRRNVGFHHIYNPNRRSRYRRKFHGIQYGQCAPSAPASLS